MVIAADVRRLAVVPAEAGPAVAHFLFAGFIARVRSTSPACLDRLRSRCEAFAIDAPDRIDAEIAITVQPDDPAGAYAAWSGAQLLRRERSPERLASRLEWWLCNEAVQRNTALLHFHAAAAAKHGAALLIPAVSGTGKSTLTLGLLARGFAILGDDVAFIEPATGHVVPFRRSFHLDVRSVVLLRRLGVRIVHGDTHQYTFPPSAFGLDTAPAPAPLRFVILPQREGLAPGELVAIDQSEALLALAPHSAALRRGAPAAAAAAARLVGDCRCFRLGSADLRLAVDALDRLVGEGP